MWRDFLHLLFPEICPGCETVLHDYESHVCSTCLHTLPILEENKDIVLQKLAGRIRATTAYSFLKFNKQGLAQKLLHELKYNHNQELGVLLGKLMAKDLQYKNINIEADCLVPVPLHKKRYRERGYNQSEMLANGLSSVLNIPVNTTLLGKSRETKSQTQKGRLARLSNSMGCYELLDPVTSEGLKVILIDDVITTGATLEACSTPLSQGNIQSISVVSFAVA